MKKAMKSTILLVFVALQVLCSQGNIRLAGGKVRNEGRVEILYNGTWGTVCDDNWDLNDAKVVCRSLGLPIASSAICCAAFGQGSGTILLDDVRCQGNEESLSDCSHRGWRSHNCGHSEDAGVVCGYPPITQVDIYGLYGVIESPGYPQHMKQAHYEWTFRSGISNARAAVFVESIDLTRSYGGVSRVTILDSTNTSLFSVQNQRRHPVGFLISSNPGSVSFYSSYTSRSGHGGNGIRMRYFVFSGSEDQSSCSEKLNITVVNDESGKVNISWTKQGGIDSQSKASYEPTYLVFYNSTRKGINNFTLPTNLTTAVIDHLSLNTSYSIEVIAFFPGSNSTVRSCPLLIRTEQLKVRLVGGQTPNEGRVEVYYHGMWGAICNQYWDRNDANVVCRSLGLRPATYVFSNTYAFGTGYKRSWMTRLQCTGSESSLADCNHAGWGNTYSRCSNRYYHAAVVCGHPTVVSINITDFTGVISSPGYPQNMTQAHYYWIFRPPKTCTYAVVYIEDLYFYRYDGGQTNLTITGVNGEQLIYSRYQNARRVGKRFEKGLDEIEYLSSSTSNRGRGFRLRYFLFNKTDASITGNWNISGESTSYQSINVAWTPYPESGVSVAGYLITCTPTEDWHDNVSYIIANGSSTSSLCHHLVGYTHYKVIVYASVIDLRDNSTMTYRSQSIAVRTQEGVPTRGPTNVNFPWVKPNSVLVQWNAIPRDQVHGVILGYRIQYYHNNYVTITTNDTQVVIRGLLPLTRYQLHISGFTVRGNGQRSYSSWTTGCGRSIMDSFQGRITSPDTFRRWITADCTWTIKASSQQGLIVVILELDMPLSFRCRENYVALTDGQGITVDKMCGRRQSFTFTSFGSAIVRYYASERWTWRQNSVMKADYYIYNNGIAGVPVIPSWNISAVSKTSTTIDVQWPGYPDNSVNVYKYMSICISKSNLTAETTNRRSRGVRLSNLMRYTEYDVHVLAFIGNNSNSSFAYWNETLKRSQVVKLRTLDDVPSQAPRDLFAQTAGSHSIAVGWHHIPQQFVHGVLIGYHIYYHVAWSSSPFSKTFIESNKTSILLEGLELFTQYSIKVAGVTRSGEGPRSRNVFSKTGCDQILSGGFGVFSSPNYPENYPSNTNCTWTIGKELNFNEMFIVFNSFDVEEGGNCRNEFVTIKDKKSNLLLGKSCGKKNPFGMSIAKRYAVVRMLSDGGIEKSGFQANYFLINESSKVFSINQEQVSETEAHLTWNTSIGGISKFVVLYREYESNDVWNAISTSTTRVSLTHLSSSTKYQVRLVGSAANKPYGSDAFEFITSSQFTNSPPEETEPPSPTPTESIKLMYDYGTSEGDSVVPSSYSGICLDVAVNDQGILIFHKRHYKLYICMNGLIRFGAPWYIHWPNTLDSVYQYHVRAEHLAMIAPYWSLVDYNSFRSGISNVYYQIYDTSTNTTKSRDVLERVTSDVKRLNPQTLQTEFQASWVLVVTWESLRHSTINSQTKNLYNTFQAVIITNGVYTFTMFNYPPNGIQWSAPTSSSNYNRFWNARGLPVVGCNAGKKNYYNVPRSGTVNIEKIDSEKGRKIFFSRRIIKSHSHDIVGKWFFRLETSTGTQNAEDKCKQWFKNEPDPRPFLAHLQPCPCTRRQAWWDERFTLPRNSWQNSGLCSISIFPSVDGWDQKCCYSTDWRSRGALVVGHPGGGTPHRYNGIKYNDHLNSDIRSYDWCCVQASLCHLYFKKRPSDDCSRYEPPEWSWMWGDPHFVTLDGKNYTFNGLGEYVLLDAKQGFFQIQARTRLAKGDGTATVFCAAVAKERNTSKVQINLEYGGNMTLLVDGETLDYYSLTNESTRLNGSVVISRPNDNAFRATFPSGISVTVTEVKGSLTTLLAIPKSFMNQTKGLLGTWNGDQSDDLTTPSGDVLPANASNKDIHFQFGQKWQVDDGVSLFTYNPGENASTFSNTSFMPMFIDDLKFHNESLKQQAYAACNGDINCLFDSASTKDVSIGLSTKIVGSQMVNESNTLKNSPPIFHNVSSNLYVKINITELVTFEAKDPDGDSMEFNVIGLPGDGIMKTSNSSVTIQWNVTSQSVELEVIVKDSKEATSVLRPVLHLCACHNGGDCLTNNEDETDRNNSRFSIMSCQCRIGYTGRFCENDIDACMVNMNPCYPGVECTDLPAPANVTGYECGPCPQGFTGKGDSCSDIDECDGSTHGCSQICANTPGSFACDCNKGFSLNIDGRTCDDVNECLPASDCMQGCVNTPGSYICTCDKYFTVDAADPKRCIAESPCKDGNHQCQHICYVSNGVDHCTCNTGYELQGDNKTCSDIDECTTDKYRCNQICRNTIGWYDCACVPGFRLDADNVTCVDIDECIEWTFNCSATKRCQNTIGSYKCQCQEGQYWIDNRCSELEQGKAPPPPPPAPKPREPSTEDVRNSVTITILKTNISEWNMMFDLDLKNAVGHEVTRACAEHNECLPKKRRQRRSNGYITFTSDQVHLLPGFPIQVYNSSISDDTFVAVSFYVKFPPGIAIGDTETIDKNTLVNIVNGSLAAIGRAIHKMLFSVKVYMIDEHSTTIHNHVPTTSTPTRNTPKGLGAVIGGSVAGAVIVLILVVIAVVLFKRKSKSQKKSEQEEPSNIEMEPTSLINPVSFINPGYSRFEMELEGPEASQSEI